MTFPSAGSPEFWEAYYKLPESVRALARKNYRLWQTNPFHPSLAFKKIGGENWSVRIGEHYRAIYHYLLSLTGRPDLAEDLTQETFLEGWRCLATFQGRGSLRSWLHRIAHRQFLHLLRRRQAEPGWHEMMDGAASDATAWMESVELREVIDRLPLPQREVVLLHYLEGYSSREIAGVVDAPASTVRRRLAQARESLRQALGSAG